MRVETVDNSYIEIDRDDGNVFVDSPSAIVLTLGTEWKEEMRVELGPTLVDVDIAHSETMLCFRMQAAREIHAELGRLIEEAPE